MSKKSRLEVHTEQVALLGNKIMLDYVTNLVDKVIKVLDLFVGVSLQKVG